MAHPFLKKTSSLIIYFSIWIALSVAGTFGSYVFYKDIEIALTENLIFNTLICLLGLALWYPVRYSRPGKTNSLNFVISHLTSICVFLLILGGIGLSLLNIIFYSKTKYLIYLHEMMPIWIISAVSIYVIYVLVYYVIIYYNDLKEKTTNENRLREVIKETELSMLKSQINPHFLFNSLNSASSLTITNPSKAQEMIIKLSDYLRYSISQPEDKMSSLDLELANSRRYLDIEQIRFGDRLTYEDRVDAACLPMKIPVMLLQPLYENAVKHGVYESTEPVCIRTVCIRKENILFITIKNNYDSSAKSTGGSGIGLRNIKDRLRLIYKSDTLIKIVNSKDAFIVELTIPQLDHY